MKALSCFEANYNRWLTVASAIGCGELSGDIVNDMYLKLHRMMRLGKLPESAIKDGCLDENYIFITLRNTFYSYKSPKIEFVTDSEVFIDKEQEVLDMRAKSEGLEDEIIQDIRVLISELSVADQQMFRHYFLSGYTMDQIATGAGISKGSVFYSIDKIRGYIRSVLSDKRLEQLNIKSKIYD